MDCADQYCREAAAAVHFLNTRRRAGEATRPSFTTMMHCQIASSVPLGSYVISHKVLYPQRLSNFFFVITSNLIPNTYKDKMFMFLSTTWAITANTIAAGV